MLFYKLTVSTVIGCIPFKFTVVYAQVRPDRTFINASQKGNSDFYRTTEELCVVLNLTGKAVKGGIRSVGSKNCKLFKAVRRLRIIDINFIVIANNTACSLIVTVYKIRKPFFLAVIRMNKACAVNFFVFLRDYNKALMGKAEYMLYK